MNAAALQAMARPELQNLARHYNVRANLKSVTIVQQLLERFPDGVPQLSNTPRSPSVARSGHPSISPRPGPKASTPARASVRPTGRRQRHPAPSTQPAPQDSTPEAPNPAPPVAPAGRSSPANMATSTPGPDVSHIPPHGPHRPSSLASNVSVQNVEIPDAPIEPAHPQRLERTVRAMDNLVSNHEHYYQQIMKKRRAVRQLRINAKSARALVAQEVAIQERLTTTLSYIRRPKGQTWTQKDVYGSMGRFRQRPDGTFKEVTSEDERNENAERDWFFRDPTGRGDTRRVQGFNASTAKSRELEMNLPILDMPAHEAYGIKLSPEPTVPRKKRSRPATVVDVDSQDSRSPKRARLQSNGPLRSGPTIPARASATTDPLNPNPNPSANQEGEDLADTTAVLELLEPPPGSGSDRSRVEGSLGSSSSLSHRANFESSPPGSIVVSPTQNLAQGEVNGSNATGSQIRDSGVDNSPPLSDAKGKQRAWA